MTSASTFPIGSTFGVRIGGRGGNKIGVFATTTSFFSTSLTGVALAADGVLGVDGTPSVGTVKPIGLNGAPGKLSSPGKIGNGGKVAEFGREVGKKFCGKNGFGGEMRGPELGGLISESNCSGGSIPGLKMRILMGIVGVGVDADSNLGKYLSFHTL